MNSVRSNSLSLKYQGFPPLGCQDKRIGKFEFVAKTQFLRMRLKRRSCKESVFYVFIYIDSETFLTWIIWSNKIHSLKYLRSRTCGCKDIELRKYLGPGRFKRLMDTNNERTPIYVQITTYRTSESRILAGHGALYLRLSPGMPRFWSGFAERPKLRFLENGSPVPRREALRAVSRTLERYGLKDTHLLSSKL